MSFRPLLGCLQTIVLNRNKSHYIFRTSFRYLRDLKKEVNFYGKEEKDLAKVRVTLKDEKGNIMGTKSLIEAKFLAQKLHLNLIEDKDVTKHFKYKEYKLVSNQYLAEMNKQSDLLIDTKKEDNNNSDTKVDDKNSSASTQTVKEVKHLVFSTKLNENDLMTKIKQIKRWLSRGHQIAINVTNPKNDKKLLVNIFKNNSFFNCFYFD